MKANSFCLIFLMFKRRSIIDLLLKNIEVILGYPLYALSFCSHRDKNKWLVGSHIGFAGNSKYFFIDTVINQRNERCYWIAASRQEETYIKQLGLPVFYRWSILGIYHSMTAYKYIFSFHLIDINFWTSGNVQRINLWHGVGIKNIEFKTNVGSAKFIYDEKNLLSRFYFPYLFKRPHLFLSTSPLMTEHFKECFRITDDKICEDFYPRCEIFRWGKKELTSFIEKYEPKETLYIINKIQLYKRTYLYMPTWRESRHNFILSAGFDFDLLNKIMTIKKQIFLIKVHPGVNLNLEEMSMYSNIIILDKKIDVYPILPFTDILITDYSSIYYDYLLLNDKHILLFPFDYEDYITYNRDLAFDYNKYTPGKRIYTFNDLLTYFRDDFSLDFVERNWICEQFWSTHSTNSVLYNKILLLNF